MPKFIKFILISFSGFVVLLILIVTGLLLFVNVNSYKSQLEASISRTLGMDVKVEGPLRISLSPGLMLTLNDVHVRNHGDEIASATKIKLGIEIFPLLLKEVRIESMYLDHPTLSIEQDHDGHLNFVTTATTAGGMPSLNLSSVYVEDGTIHYTGKASGEVFEADKCSLKAHHLRLTTDSNVDFKKNLSFTADLTCAAIRNNDLPLSDLKVRGSGKNGIFDLDPVTMQVFGGQGSGSLHADYSGTIARYSIHYSLPQFQIAEFFKLWSPQSVADGRMDFSANLSSQGMTTTDLRRNLGGWVRLRAKQLILKGVDLDENISYFESSQHFNLVDVAAVFLTGPFGLVVTKGYNFASLLQGSSGSSKINTLVSDWQVENGVAHAQDAAMATSKNRVALKGGLDFINDTFDDVTVAVINARGCAMVKQKIRGSFQNPVVENPNIIKSLTGPVRKLIKAGRDLFPGGKCKVFYAGSVEPTK